MPIKKRDHEREIATIVRGSQHFDAGESDFIVRQLLAVKAKLYAVEYPTLKARDFIPIASDVDAYAEAIAFQMTDGFGKTKIVANDADDLPDVDVSTGEAQTPVRTLGGQYGYSWLDLQRAARQRSPLTMRKALRGRKATEEGIDLTLRAGDADSGLAGFINNALITPTAAAGNYNVPALTAQQIANDINSHLVGIGVDTKGVHDPQTVLMPISTYGALNTTPWSATGQSDLTILDFLKGHHPGVAFEPWYALETAGAGGVKRMVVYDKNPDVIEGQLPLDFYEFPPQARGFRLVIPFLARVGGCQLRYPKAMRYVDGV